MGKKIIELVNNNKHKYAVKEIFKILNVPKSRYYYQLKQIKNENDSNEQVVIKVFKENRSTYGARRLQVEIAKQNIIISRKEIRQIMIKNNLVSKYDKPK